MAIVTRKSSNYLISEIKRNGANRAVATLTTVDSKGPVGVARLTFFGPNGEPDTYRLMFGSELRQLRDILNGLGLGED